MDLLTGAPSLKVLGTQFPGAYTGMPNPGWQTTQREQMLQEQLKHEHQQFDAWKLEMENKTLYSQVSQPQVQAPAFYFSWA